jgi:hypothetical protein
MDGTGVDMKRCSKCHELKSEEEFSWNIKGVERHSACNACRAIEQAEYYNRTKPDRLKYKAKRQVSKREEARAYVFDYLSHNPYVDCGQSDPMVLTFDHVKGVKRMGISQMVNQGYSIEAIREEIDKCVVRCGNCHLRIEKQRREIIYPRV